MVYALAQSLLLAAEEGAEEDAGIDLLLPAPEELIAGVIAFAVVFFFVWKFAVPAINKILEARQQAIRDNLDAAESAKQEAESLLRDYKDQLANAKEEANRIVDDARQSGEAVKADIVDRAEGEADQIKDRARDEIASERERVSADLERQVADLSLDVAEKVVAGSLDREAQRELVDRYIDELGGVQ
jgi:F-type H+-transporting ATPase subunit b